MTIDDGSPWWQTAVLYQIYVRSFADADGDGVGDVAGVLERLDHLVWLGVDAIWLTPVTVSPNRDWGYDVADYCAVQPELGTLASFDALVDAAHDRGMRVLLDFVPNHTSDEHPWFVASRSSRDDPKRDWYVWADPAPGGAPPNNWVSSFGGVAWTLDEGTGQYYLHNHLREQPDLNWWNADVRDTFDGIMRFWFDHGVDGFRIDVCNVIVKDAHLRDNPPATADDPLDVQLFGQRPVYNANRPEVHDVLRRWRAVADSYEPPRVLLGETPVADAHELAAYYGEGDELHLAFNFPFITVPLEADAMRAMATSTYAALPPDTWPAWTGSNHDMGRFASRWADGDPARARAALFVLLGLRGTPVLYQGDEIGLTEHVVEPPHLRDPLGVQFWPAYAGRDGSRTPMPWRDTPGGGFTRAAVEPWLPIGDRTRNVEHQRDDPTSMLHLTRDLLALRRRTPDLHLGSQRNLIAPDRVWAWARGDRHVVAVNLSDDPASIDAVTGRILVASDRGRDGARCDGTLTLAPWDAVVLRTDD